MLEAVREFAVSWRRRGEAGPGDRLVVFEGGDGGDVGDEVVAVGKGGKLGRWDRGLMADCFCECERGEEEEGGNQEDCGGYHFIVKDMRETTSDLGARARTFSCYSFDCNYGAD